MQVLLLVAGLILLLVNPPLFAAAGTVGVICLAVFAAITVVQLAILGVGLASTRSVKKRFDRF